MTMIDVDFEVFKELTVRRRSEDMTENDVLRELLGLSLAKTTSSPTQQAPSPEGLPWVTKGVTFPHGTEFRATHKGRQYTGTVKNGALEIHGNRYPSPSAAAVKITGTSVNGWRFWECLIPGNTKWKLISELRR